MNLLIFRLLGAQVRSQMQYRASFLTDAVSTFLLNGAQITAIAAGLGTFGGVAGWTVPEILFLAGMVDLSFGLMDMIFSGFDPDYFSQNVRRGQLSTHLLRPADVWVQVLGSRFELRRIGRISLGVVTLALAISNLSIEWTLLKVAYIPAVVFGQVLCYGSLFMVGATITLWTIDRTEIMNIVTYGSTEMTTYPMAIYPPYLRHVFTFIVPTIFLNYYPALYILGKPDPLNFPPFAPYIAPLIGMAMIAVAGAFFNAGLRRYQDAGS
jgi:ABC-2 type transport system permease protein